MDREDDAATVNINKPQKHTEERGIFYSQLFCYALV